MPNLPGSPYGPLTGATPTFSYAEPVVMVAAAWEIPEWLTGEPGWEVPADYDNPVELATHGGVLLLVVVVVGVWTWTRLVRRP